MLSKYRQAFAGNTAWRFSTAGFIARLPVSMVGIGILMYVEAERGSYTSAGAVSGSISIVFFSPTTISTNPFSKPEIRLP